MLRVKRVYEAQAPEDGRRYLVDRLWPRGLTKEAAALDAWLKELAPSNALRQWFHHAPDDWEEFRRRYREELAAAAVSPLLEKLRAESREGVVTLLFAAKNAQRNNAVCLKDILEGNERVEVAGARR